MTSARINRPVPRETQIRRLQIRFGLSRTRATLYAELHFGGLSHAKG